jgi:hypothetical protein
VIHRYWLCLNFYDLDFLLLIPMLQQASEHLELDPCPQCNIAKPLLTRIWQTFDDPHLAEVIKDSSEGQ